MCLGIPAQLIDFGDDHPHLATAEVSGVRRKINIGLLEDEGLEVGDWVLLHVGFAMSRIDEAEAARALEDLKLMGRAYDAELIALTESNIN